MRLEAADLAARNDGDASAGGSEVGRRGGGGQVGARSSVGDAQRVQVLDGVAQPGRATVADVVVGEAREVEPRVLQPLQQARVAGEDKPVCVVGEVVLDRTLEIGHSDIGAAEQFAHGALVAGTLGLGDGPTEGRAAVVAGDRHRPAFPWEIDALAFVVTWLATPRSSIMSPPATSVHVPA